MSQKTEFLWEDSSLFKTSQGSCLCELIMNQWVNPACLYQAFVRAFVLEVGQLAQPGGRGSLKSRWDLQLLTRGGLEHRNMWQFCAGYEMSLSFKLLILWQLKPCFFAVLLMVLSSYLWLWVIENLFPNSGRERIHLFFF